MTPSAFAASGEAGDVSNVITLPLRSNRQIPDALKANIELGVITGTGGSYAPLHAQIRTAAVSPPPLVLDRADPLKSAQAIVARHFTQGGLRVLHHHPGLFYQWDNGFCRPLDEDTVSAALLNILGDSMAVADGAQLVPYRPTRARVSDVREALTAECNIPGRVEPRAGWMVTPALPRPASDWRYET